MAITPQHTNRRMFRQLVAAGMTVLYLVIIFSPLAAFAMHSATTAPVVGRECSGDCNICGCSPESRASNTCCCSKKRQQQVHAHEDDEDGTPDCCKKKPLEKKTVISCGCPCGNGKPATLSSVSSSEILPFHFTEKLSIPHTNTSFFSLTHRLTSRHGEPPDPPPRLARKTPTTHA